MTFENLAITSDETQLAEDAESLMIESLPYIDEISEEYMSYANSLVDYEFTLMKREGITASSVGHKLPSLPPNLSDRLEKTAPIFLSEYQRVESGLPVTPVDFYSTSQKFPDPSSSISSGLDSSTLQWKRACNAAKIDYEYQSSRCIDLEIMSRPSPLSQEPLFAESWKRHNALLEKSARSMQSELSRFKMYEVDATNVQRRDLQVGAQPRLTNLRRKYGEAYTG
eukprot:CAMPEP_0194340418 /NCGR_PEP_ID=MMETSP0171-20130528/86296_1 /TAXON_ID=218684 /ORGANISM="Corethron pennatum, Strain L29A3" /LENGTH=224 /DNA_ID=CAMNT_0039105365 /DNA_START=110 /DNA_END=780 /DNA_ORIENTATION=-